MAGIHGITPFTLLDYPDEVACIVWFSKCNLRCLYCHNPEILSSPGTYDDALLKEFLESRRGKLTAVVLSGGEPTFCPDILDYAAYAKSLGYKVKLDTNGTNPAVVRELIEHGFIDYIALDYKSPPEKAKALTGTDKFTAAFDEALIDVIAANNAGRIDLEIRTTLYTKYLNEDDINKMIARLEVEDYRGTYYLQNIVSTGEKTFGNIEASQAAFDFSKLVKPKKFKLDLRNFPKASDH